MGMLRGLLQHPDEVPSIVRLRLASRAITRLPKDADLAFCYDMLNRVSRSFAIVIQQLGQELRDAVCVFYLILRALDTVEDDMAIPIKTKLPILKEFHIHIYDASWKFPCGEKNYRLLMENFHHVVFIFKKLEKRYQDVIANVTRQMGAGMAKFITTEVETVEHWDEYCHYVAGLVGIGLSDLFVAGGLESPAPEGTSNSMGLFLQKTNIIRDYLEDINEEPAPRMFWPKEVWSLYADKLADFKDVDMNGDKAVKCLNHLITNTLRHGLDCLLYLATVKNQAVFRFCAIPQIMAMGTLTLCYGEPRVFTGVVKMRKGLAAKIMDKTLDMTDVYGAFHDFANWMSSKVDLEKDPNAQITLNILKNIQAMCEDSGALHARRSLVLETKGDRSARMVVWLFFVMFAIYAFGLFGAQEHLLGIHKNFLGGELECFQKALASFLLVGSTLLLLQPLFQKVENDI